MESTRGPVDGIDHDEEHRPAADHAPEDHAKEADGKTPRRNVIRAAGVAAVGGLAWAASQVGTAQAASGDALTLGQSNDAGTDGTFMVADPGGDAVLNISNSGGNTSVALAGSGAGMQAIGSDIGVIAVSTDGTNDGLRVYSEGPKVAVYGKATAPGGAGIYGKADPGDDGSGHGVLGEHTKQDGAGVTGKNPAGTGIKGEGKYGVHGKSGASDGLGTYSENTHASGVGARGKGGKIGLFGDANSTDGAGVVGFNSATPTPPPSSPVRAGKAVAASIPAAVIAAATNGLYTGVTGVGDDVGVQGHSDSGTGVTATTSTGTALQVTAETSSGTALEVVGKACFDNGGESGQTITLSPTSHFTVPSIPSGAASVKVLDPRITTKSFISVVFVSDPGNGTAGRAAVSYVARATGSFTVFLSQKVTKKTSFAYFFVELCPPGVA